MPMGHLWWRFSEGRTAVIQVRASSACEWPSCPWQGSRHVSLRQLAAPLMSERELGDGMLKDPFTRRRCTL
jgi:hypothetical protein